MYVFKVCFYHFIEIPKVTPFDKEGQSGVMRLN